ELTLNRFEHLRMLMSEQQRAVTAVVIDVFVAVDVPLARTQRMVAVDAIGPHAARLVHDAARQYLACVTAQLRGAPGAGVIRREDRGVARRARPNSPTRWRR